jgi:hypothetical protein
VIDGGLRIEMPRTRRPGQRGFGRLLRVQVDSPAALDFRTADLDLLILGVKSAPADLLISVQARDRGKRIWRALTRPALLESLLSVRAGYLLSLPHSSRQVEQLRLVLETRSEVPITFERIALYPVTARASTHP